MNAKEAGKTTRRAAPANTPTTTPIPSRDSVPVHDLLVMSHGAGARPGSPSNHACLNSFAKSSWIISDGGRPNTIAGRK